jgi:1,2-diacylglycerol 3-alpha-glucosyltransferase
MRILMVTNTYAPARNGVSQCVRLFVRELRARGHAVDVLTYRHPMRGNDECVYAAPAFIGLDTDFLVSPVQLLPGELRGRTWDVVHIHHPVMLAYKGIGIAKESGAPVVFTAHSVYTHYLDHYAGGMARPLKPALEARVRHTANACDLILTPSTHAATTLGDWGVRTPTLMLESAADTERVVPAPRARARARLGLAEDAPVALYVGRIAAEKHIDHLVAEFAIARAQVPAASLVLVGAGPQGRHVATVAKAYKLDSSVRFFGPSTGEELGLWYSAADVHVSASASETGPLTVVEAMACGTPTVAFRGPGFEDRVVDGVNGLLPERADGALGDAMAAVLGDAKLRERLGEGARVRAGRYTPERVVGGLESCYQDLLSGKEH